MSSIEDRKADVAPRRRSHGMTSTAAQEIERLEAELSRLDAQLCSDQSFAALCQLDERAARGEALLAIDEASLRRSLEESLATNPHFAARQAAIEAIRLLKESGVAAPTVPSPAAAQPATQAPRASRLRLSERIALIDPIPRGDVFRTRVNVKPADAPPPPLEPPVATVPLAAPHIEPIPAAEMPVTPTRPDDFTRIKSIDPALAARLHGLGIATYDAIANWTAADVRRVKGGLALGRRIAREGWIEQAALLAKGRSSTFSASPEGYDIATPSADTGTPPSAATHAAPDQDCSAPASHVMAVRPWESAGGTSALPNQTARVKPAILAEVAVKAPSPGPANEPPAGGAHATVDQPSAMAAPAVEQTSAAGAAPAPEISPRTLAMFERGRWQEDARSLQATVMAAEAAARHRLHQPGAAAEARRPISAMPSGTVAATGTTAVATVNPGSQSPAPTTAMVSLPVAPPPPPTPYRAPITKFGQAPQTEVDLADIVRDLRHATGNGAADAKAIDGEDEADLPGPESHAEEAAVEIVARKLPPRAGPACDASKSVRHEEPLRPLPVKPRPPVGTAPQVRVLESEGHEAYRGVLMEASVEIIQYDEEGRRIPKAAPKAP